jgi:hypothetical protein
MHLVSCGRRCWPRSDPSPRLGARPARWPLERIRHWRGQARRVSEPASRHCQRNQREPSLGALGGRPATSSSGKTNCVPWLYAKRSVTGPADRPPPHPTDQVPLTKPIRDLIFRIVFSPESTLDPANLAAVLSTEALHVQIERQRTGPAPMTQKITKNALLGLTLPDLRLRTSGPWWPPLPRPAPRRLHAARWREQPARMSAPPSRRQSTPRRARRPQPPDLPSQRLGLTARASLVAPDAAPSMPPLLHAHRSNWGPSMFFTQKTERDQIIR